MSADPAEGQDHGFSDEPLADLTDDVLGRDRFAMSAVDLIERVGASPESTVLAVVGQWGLGKTTLLNAIRTELKGRVRRGKFWITAEFNPWYYQDLASLQVGFFRELSAALPSGPSWQKARTRIADFADAVAPLGAFAAPLGADISPMIERAAAMTRGGTGVLDAKAAVEKSLRKVDRPVLMVIDDIDRLDPAELLLLFKLIRLAGRLPNVYYLLAYDEETLLDALSRTGLIGADSPRRALDYMEKIIQVRLDLPPVRERQLSSWVDRELTLSAGRLGVALDKAQRERFDKAYFGHIRLRLRTPRAVQRLFTQVESLASNLAHEVDFVDFFILSWMRSAEPLLYRAISQHRTRLLGEMLDPSGEGWPFDRDKQADHAHWAAVMSRARVDQPHVEGVARIMGQLFPKFAEQWAGESASSVPTQGRVAHSNYFDRFFAFAVPADDVSDQMVRKALSQVAEERDGPEREQLGQLWSTQADLLIEKVGRYWVPGRVDGVIALRWLARWYLLLPNDDYSMAPPRRRLVNIAYTHFITLEQAEPAAAVRVMMEEDPSLEFVEGVVSYIAGDAVRTSARSPEFVAAEAAFAERVAHVFREQGSTNPLDYPDRVWNLFRSWVYADAPAVRAWVRHHRDAGSWPLLDLLARMVSRAVPMGVPDPVAIVGELDLLLVDEVVGLNEVRDGLREELARSQPGLSHRAPATPDNLRVAALMQLRASDGTRSET